MLPLLSFHALAASRGDGLKPELLVLLARHAGLAAGFTPDDARADDAPQPCPADDARGDTGEPSA